MARSWYVNGESMVWVVGNAAGVLGTTRQLGLTADAIQIIPNFKHKPIHVDAWGGGMGGATVEVQYFLQDVELVMNFIHFDLTVMSACLQESQGLTSVAGVSPGVLGRTGALMGNNLPRGAAGNHYISVNIASPVEANPFRFYYCYMTGPPVRIPLGTEKSVFSTHWIAIAYTNDPWGGGSAQPGTVAGTGSAGAIIWDNVLDAGCV